MSSSSSDAREFGVLGKSTQRAQLLGSERGLRVSDREYGVHRIDEGVVVSLGLPSLVRVKPVLDISPAPQASIGDEAVP